MQGGYLRTSSPPFLKNPSLEKQRFFIPLAAVTSEANRDALFSQILPTFHYKMSPITSMIIIGEDNVAFSREYWEARDGEKVATILKKLHVVRGLDVVQKKWAVKLPNESKLYIL
ncbi:hypothetical protein HDV00_009498 [Rhizophlyctis rosea]|nr:hypothetical protein HDV00_009498 [Rhizophlyctis rosea]